MALTESGIPLAPHQALLRRMLRNSGTLLTGKLAMGLINLAATSIALRSLGAESLGLILMIHGLGQMASMLLRFQSWQAVLRYGAVSLEAGDGAGFRSLLRFTAGLDFTTGLLAAVLTAAAIWGFGPAFEIGPELVPAAMLYTTSTLFLATATPTGVLRLFNRFDLLATRDAFGAVIRLAGCALAALLGWGLMGFLLVWYLATALGGIALVQAAWQEVRRQGLLRGPAGERLPRAATAHPGLWHFVWTTNITTTLSLTSGRIGTLCVGLVLGPTEVALYEIGRQVGEAALKPGRFLSPAIYPELARLAASGDSANMRALLGRVLRLSTGGAVVLLAVLWLLSDPLLRLIGGAEALPARSIMLYLGAASAIGFAAFALEPLLMSVDRQGAALRARLLATVIFVPATLLGLSWDGLDGAGWASILTALIMVVAQLPPAIRLLRGNTAGHIKDRG